MEKRIQIFFSLGPVYVRFFVELTKNKSPSFMYPFFPFPMPLLIFFLLFLRRIKDGTEGTIVLVGQLESLKKPAVALVRLAEGKIPLIFYFLFFYIHVIWMRCGSDWRILLAAWLFPAILRICKIVWHFRIKTIDHQYSQETLFWLIVSKSPISWQLSSPWSTW